MAAEEKTQTLHEHLSDLIILSDRLIKLANLAESSKSECSDLAKQASQLAQNLRCTVRLAAAPTPLYERPIRRISADVSKNLNRAIALVKKCKHSGLLRQVFAITTSTDFRKASILLESSIGDVKWILSVFDSEAGTNLTLPPIASNDPILAWVWSYIAAVQMGQVRDRVDAANELASLAFNDRNKKIIVEEGGVPPLLKLLKEGASPESQIAAATALLNLATDKERVRLICDENAVQVIVRVLNDSPMKVRIPVVNLVSRMAEMDHGVQEDFGRENVTRPLVTLMSMDIVLDDPKSGKSSLHSLVQINKELAKNSPKHHGPVLSNSSSSLHSFSEGIGNRGVGVYRKEKEIELPEMKLTLKISCARALWKLSKGCLLNCKKITETKALICLAKLIEQEKGELQTNCLMIVMELAAVAESDTELRRSAFKPSSPAAKAVVDQLLRVISKETNPILLIPSIRSIGSLARTFSAKEARIIHQLVLLLNRRDSEVATEAATALVKFACPENFNHVEHSKAIIEFNGADILADLVLAKTDWAQVPELKLLCYLALNVDNSPALEKARALKVIELGARAAAAQNPDSKELFASALRHLLLYHVGDHMHPHR